MQVEPEHEIGPHLEQLGIRPADVRWVVLTHLHTDHAGGVRHFPGNEILVSGAELEYATGLRGRFRGYIAFAVGLDLILDGIERLRDAA